MAKKTEDTPKRVYIAGKVTGLSEKEYMKNFVEAEKMIRKEGDIPVNPILLAGFELTHAQYLKMDKVLIDSCDAIYLQDNWEESEGAQEEKAYAEKKHLEVWEHAKI